MSENILNYFNTMFWGCAILTILTSIVGSIYSNLFKYSEGDDTKTLCKKAGIILRLAGLTSIASVYTFVAAIVLKEGIVVIVIWAFNSYYWIKRTKKKYIDYDMTCIMNDLEENINYIQEILRESDEIDDDE